jgi:hypothetical protein
VPTLRHVRAGSERDGRAHNRLSSLQSQIQVVPPTAPPVAEGIILLPPSAISKTATRREHAPLSSKVCPYCAQLIQSEAIKCLHCGEILDAELRSARGMAEAQGDGIGLISIVCSALALTGTIAGLLCMGWGTLIGIPIAITGLILAAFATKHKKAAFILNSAAILPPVLAATLVAVLGFGAFAAFGSCCCIAPAAIAPLVAVAQKGVAPIVNQAPTKRANLPPKQKAPILKNDDGALIKEEPSETQVADRLYAQGKHEEAVKKYKGLFASTQKEEQATQIKTVRRYILSSAATSASLIAAARRSQPLAFARRAPDHGRCGSRWTCQRKLDRIP